MGLILIRLLTRCLLLAISLAFSVVALIFLLIHLAPGDPTVILAGEGPTPEFLKAVRAEYGLDKPVLAQFLAFLAKAATGDFGLSIYYGRPVFSVILDRFPATVVLTSTAMIFAGAIGVFLGVSAARRAGSKVEALISAIALTGYSVPGF